MDKDTWDAITAISTASAAIFTAVMAWFTRKAIIEGQRQRHDANDHFAKTREQDKWHHEDTFRPLLVLSPSSVADTVDRKDILSCYGQGTLGVVIIKCVLKNIGTGPAVTVRVHVRADRRVGFGPSRELVPLGAGSVIYDAAGQIEIAVSLGAAFNGSDLNNLPHGLWLLVLEYEDVFGNPFYTLHSKHLGEPWSRSGRGPAPDTNPPPPARVHTLAPGSPSHVSIEAGPLL